MKTGTKSILFGVHQFVIHPIVVLIAWITLYGRPNWKTMICIVIHDWGYWGKARMDDEDGERHPEWAADFVWDMFHDMDMWALCMFHSRHHARSRNAEPSRLCWADKLSIIYEPWWFYLPRAWASGELQEYRITAAKGGFFPAWKSNRKWYEWIQERFTKLAKEKRGDAVPYANPERLSLGGNGSGGV
ncbi:MAG: hypothetical protein LLG97_19540 [Deltaproteobacteria bacterium]|nr:hypothetical protein [Deltaproteobacteria bacterium]